MDSRAEYGAPGTNGCCERAWASLSKWAVIGIRIYRKYVHTTFG